MPTVHDPSEPTPEPARSGYYAPNGDFLSFGGMENETGTFTQIINGKYSHGNFRRYSTTKSSVYYKMVRNDGASGTSPLVPQNIGTLADNYNYVYSLKSSSGTYEFIFVKQTSTQISIVRNKLTSYMSAVDQADSRFIWTDNIPFENPKFNLSSAVTYTYKN